SPGRARRERIIPSRNRRLASTENVSPEHLPVNGLICSAKSSRPIISYSPRRDRIRALAHEQIGTTSEAVGRGLAGARRGRPALGRGSRAGRAWEELGRRRSGDAARGRARAAVAAGGG